MRITGGLAKGRLLLPLRNLNIRPTADRIRETIFNIIGQDLQGLNVLDLFAGTGSLGLEALSRGAKGALFIDKSEQAINLIRRNLIHCGFESLGAVSKRDLTKEGIPWHHPLIREGIDLAFLDPPYGSNAIPPLLEELSAKKGLLSRSLAVVESAKDAYLPDSFGGLKMVDCRVYGDTKLTIFAYGVE
jgi:16S rRNA (guanine966-N2)-methyltransferase